MTKPNHPGYEEIGRRAYVGGRDGAEVTVNALESYRGHNYALAWDIATYIRKAWGMCPQPELSLMDKSEPEALRFSQSETSALSQTDK
jgi:hypothetical protein